MTIPPDTTMSPLADRAHNGTPPDATAKRVVVGSPYWSEGVMGPQGQRLIPTITHDMSGTTGLSACMVVMPPGGVSRAHVHQNTEIIVVCIEGFAATLIGAELQPVFHGPGEFIYIPEGTVHAAVNLSATERLVAIEARTDPHLNIDVVPTPEHEAHLEEIAAQLRSRYASGDLETPPHWRTGEQGPFAFQDDRLRDAAHG